MSPTLETLSEVLRLQSHCLSVHVMKHFLHVLSHALQPQHYISALTLTWLSPPQSLLYSTVQLFKLSGVICLLPCDAHSLHFPVNLLLCLLKSSFRAISCSLCLHLSPDSVISLQGPFLCFWFVLKCKCHFGRCSVKAFVIMLWCCTGLTAMTTYTNRDFGFWTVFQPLEIRNFKLFKPFSVNKNADVFKVFSVLQTHRFGQTVRKKCAETEQQFPSDWVFFWLSCLRFVSMTLSWRDFLKDAGSYCLVPFNGVKL